MVECDRFVIQIWNISGRKLITHGLVLEKHIPDQRVMKNMFSWVLDEYDDPLK